MKKKYFLLILLLISFFLFFFNLDSIRSTTTQYLTENQKQKIRELFFGKGTANLFKKYKKYGKMNYNQAVLPKTQFLDINLKEVSLKKLNLNSGNSKYNPLSIQFFLEQTGEDVVLVDAKGKIFFINKNFINNSINLNWTQINSNLQFKNEKNSSTRDVLILNNEIYISYSDYDAEGCTKVNISKAKISKEKLNFEIFFQSADCGPELDAGRMSFYKHNGKEGLLITTDTDLGGRQAQDDNSSFGKILFVDFENRDSIIFSKGHRTPQGLSVENNIILSAEHGPRGGDEINLIQFGQNYGWPISSYGEPYFIEKFYKSESSKNMYFYLKNHSDQGFVEPIYVFVPSIGINQIIKVPDNFSEFWKNNFLVTSLNGKNIYRILFDNDFDKLIYHEKIFIGKRMRDIIYVKNFNVFLLALEGSKHSKVDERLPSIGILSTNFN